MICDYCHEVACKCDGAELIENSGPGLKYDSGKARLDLLPPHAQTLVAKVLMHGAAKYGENNWRLIDNHEKRYLAASLRHIFSHLGGEEKDPESGLPHLAHAACSLLFILDTMEKP